MLNLKHLYYYHVFAHELSTVKAAKRLGITSPALSNQLKQFEGCLGVPLTKRINSKVLLTEPGEMVKHYTDRMFSVYTELKAKLSYARDLKNTHFRVGICRYLGAQFTFDLLSLIEKSNLTRSQQVHITFESPDVLTTGFLKDRFDLVLGVFPPEMTRDNTCISQSLAFPVRLFAPLLVKPVSTDLTEIIEIANTKKISLVLPMQPSVLRDETDRILKTSNVQPHRTIESNSSNAIVQLISRGFAMGFAPTPCLLDFKSARGLSVLGPPEGYWSHGISTLIQKSEQRTSARSPRLSELFSPTAELN